MPAMIFGQRASGNWFSAVLVFRGPGFRGPGFWLSPAARNRLISCLPPRQL
jgi:hypothetical protein